MKKSITIAAILLLASGAIFASGSSETGTPTPENPITFKLADNSPLSTPLCAANEVFAEYVAEATNGAINIEVYPDAQLGNENETIEQVKGGVLDMTRVNIIQLAQYDDNFQVFNLPYIFVDDAQRWAVTDGAIGQALNEEFHELTSMNILNYLDSGWRCFYTTKNPVENLADLKGMKIRVMNSASNISMIKSFGAVATPMAYSDVFTALQTGVIDGAENDFVSYDTSGHFEVAKNYTLDRHTASFGVLLMGDKAKAKISEEQYQILVDCAQRAAEWQRTAMVEKENESMEKVIAAGSTIYEIDVNEFQNVVQPVYDEYSDLKPLIDQIYAL
jgi:tripartite ATP-independent transporter DctP family solute receptor